MNRFARTFALLAALLAVAPVAAQQVLPPGQIDGAGNVKLGPLTLGKRNSGKFSITPDTLEIKDEGSSGPASGLSAKPAGAGAVNRLLSDILADIGTVKSFGAACNGSANDTAAAQAAATAVGEVRLSRGCLLRIATTTTFNVPVVGREGAEIRPDGAVVTLARGYSGPLARAFNTFNGASVAFPTGVQAVVYPEWWGASTNTTLGNPDWLPALQKAASSGAASVFISARNYHISAGWLVSTPAFEIAGAGGGHVTLPTSVNRSKIILDSATGNTLTLGQATAPVALNFTAVGQRVRDLVLGRSVAPACNGTGNLATDPAVFQTEPAALSMQYTHTSFVERVQLWEGCIGARFTGTVGTHAQYLRVIRTLPSSGPGAEHISYFVDGNPVNGTAGGNASLYLENSNSSTLPAATLRAQMLFVTSPYADLFVRGLENSGSKCGTILGNIGATPDNVAYKSANQDVEISHLVCDQNPDGFSIIGTNPYGNITVQDSYIAMGPTAEGTNAAIEVRNSQGAVNLLNNQGLGWYNSQFGTTGSGPGGEPRGNAIGLFVLGSSNIQAKANKWVGFSRANVLLSNGSTKVDMNRFEDTILFSGGYPNLPAIYCVGCDRNHFAPIINGNVPVPVAGIQLDASSNFNTIDRTTINPNIVTAKVVDGGVGTVLIGPAP